MNNTVKNVIIKKLPDKLYMHLARFDITTVSKLKQIVQQEGCYDDIWSDRPKFQNTKNTLNKNHHSPKYNNASINKNRSQNYNQASTSQNRNQYNNRNNNSCDQSYNHLYQEFRQKLGQAQAQNPVNYQQSPVSSTTSNQAIKRQRASTSRRSKMDTSENFHLHASDEEEDKIPS